MPIKPVNDIPITLQEKKASYREMVRQDISYALKNHISTFEFEGDYNYKYLANYAREEADIIFSRSLYRDAAKRVNEELAKKLNLKHIDLSKVGEFVTTNLKKGGKYISDNKGTILKGIGQGVGFVLTTMCGGVPVQYGNREGKVIKFPSIDTQGILTLNSTQAAIAAVEKAALKAYWDSERIKAIDKISELVPADADQYTKMYAISALQRIADKADWSQAKDRALSAITKLA